MKLLKKEPVISKTKVKQLFLAATCITLGLYILAMISSLLGYDYFIVTYQNAQMDRIEAWLRDRSIYSLATWFFSAIEFFIVLCFVLKKRASLFYFIGFYVIAIIPAFFLDLPDIFYYLYPFVLYLICPIIDQIIENKQSLYKEKFSWKTYSKQLLRVLIAALVTLVLQIMLYVIKAGYFSTSNHILHLSGFFIYSLEYDIALFVILITVSLYLDREKGGSSLWTTCQVHGGSSQTTKTDLQKHSSELKKNLTKAQRNRLTRFWVKLYLTQLLSFLLLMVLPFLLGKVLEFLTMYLAFAIARNILGFKYSLHFKKESVCITVGVIVFGILSLAVPFFTATMIIAIVLGITLAVLLHLSYKYKGMWLFHQVSKPDKFALLYVFFDGNLEYNHVRHICRLKGLEPVEADLIADFMQGEKLTYLAKNYSYSLRMLIYKLDSLITKLGADPE